MSETKVVFWDVYGTLVTAQRGNLDALVEREGELRGAFERTIKNFGLNGAPAAWHDLFIRGIRAERETRIEQGFAHPEVRIDEIWFKLLEKFQTENPPTINFAREVALFFERAANPTQLQPNAFQVLSALKQRGLRHGLISNAQFYTPIELSALLRDESASSVYNLESLFDPALVFFSFDLGVAKPDLLAFQHAVDALTREGVMPDDCVFVGNSLTQDIVPAQHIGFRTVLFSSEAPLESPVQPDIVIHNLSQLLEWL